MMKTFEEYEAEAAWEAHLENALRVARREAAERRRKAIRRAVLLWVSVALVLAALVLTRDTGKLEPEAPTVTAGRLAGDETPAAEYASLILWQELGIWRQPRRFRRTTRTRRSKRRCLTAATSGRMFRWTETCKAISGRPARKAAWSTR